LFRHDVVPLPNLLDDRTYGTGGFQAICSRRNWYRRLQLIGAVALARATPRARQAIVPHNSF
jgi:hypothetical protein